jgi:hypothetical protein
MRREFHVRFCEGLGVRFPGATRLVMLFDQEEDARRVLAVLPERFGKYGLRLHPEKTRIVPFQRPRGGKGSSPRPGTFDLLGFTHYWGRSRKGNWVVKRRTMRARFGRAVRSISEWLRIHRHDPIRKQHETLVRKLQGHDGYYGITSNSAALARLRYWVERAWRRWLSTRSRHGRLSWARMRVLLARFPLPRPRVVHSALPRVANP